MDVIRYSHIFLYFSLHYLDVVTPNNMSLATLVPNPKNKRKCLNDCSTYRAIALGSIFSKISDIIIIMEKHYSIFMSSELQFDLKAKHSTHLLLRKLLIFITEMTRQYIL